MDDEEGLCMCGNFLSQPYDCHSNGHSPVSTKSYYGPNEFNHYFEEGTKTMNYSTAVMLFNQEIRAVKVSYDPDDKVNGLPRAYLFKTLDPDIKVGDFVTIPTDTRHKMTVARVEEVEAEVDFDLGTEIKWVVSRVPVDEYQAILADEQQWIAEMKKAQNRKKKEDIKKNMIEMYQADGASLETLAIAGRKPAPTCLVIEQSPEPVKAEG